MTKKLSNSDLISIGFAECTNFTVGNVVNFDLGRRRYLSASCVGECNEVVYLCEKSEVGEHFTDLVCVHNFDYDGFLTLERIKSLIELFKG